MPLRVRALAVAAAAFAALATTWAIAAAVQPAAHQFIKGEQFRYSRVLTFGFSGGEGAIDSAGPQTLADVEDIRVVDVSASGATLAYTVEVDQTRDLTNVSDVATVTASFSTPNGTIIRTNANGTWRYPDGRIAENIVTWDPAQLGRRPAALTAGQHWPVNIPGTMTSAPIHGVVRVVSVGPNALALHVESTPPLSSSGDVRGANGWYADIAFEDGIVREIHRLAVERIGTGARCGDARFESRIRLVKHSTP